jgi:hypothetical protein
VSCLVLSCIPLLCLALTCLAALYGLKGAPASFIMDDHALPKDVASSVGWAVFLLCLGPLLVLRTPGVVSSPRTQLHTRIVFLGLCFGGLALHCTASFHAATVTMLLITWSPMVFNAWWQWQQSLSPLVDRSKQSGPPQFFKMKTPVTCLPCKQ